MPKHSFVAVSRTNLSLLYHQILRNRETDWMEIMAEAKTCSPVDMPFFLRKPSQQENAEFSSAFCGKLTFSIQHMENNTTPGPVMRTR